MAEEDSTLGALRPSGGGSVRVRRSTISRPTGLAASPILEGRAASPSAVSQPGSDASPAEIARASSPQSRMLAVGGGESTTFGRRRAGTITQRLFADSDAASNRDRSGSISSAHAVAPVSVGVPGRSSVDEPRGVQGRPRAFTGASAKAPTLDEIHHAQDEVDVLEVMDQSVSTTAALTNIQSAFIPNWFTRAPVLELDPATPDEAATPTSHAGLDDIDPLDAHLAKLLKKQKRKTKTAEIMKGIKAFILTPIGIFFAIYGIVVVISGGSLVLMLAIPSNHGQWTAYRKKLWIEIFSQILTGMFTITSLLPLPWRVFDWLNIITIARYARVTYRRRAKLNLPPLLDPNDLPEPADAPFWIGPGGEKMSGPRTKPSPLPPKAKKGKKGAAATPVSDQVQDAELGQMEANVGQSSSLGSNKEEEVVVLTDKEEAKLRKALRRFSKSQTWYRPHTSPTHHASPIKWAVWFTLLMIGNSIFQAMLCGVMWGLNRWERPAWTTGCLIPLSFGCGIGAAVIVWQAGERTKRKAEVTASVWRLLKQDEEALEARRKEVHEKREKEKALEKEKEKAAGGVLPFHRHSHSKEGASLHASPSGEGANRV